jgi:Uma2 family endonuclease
MATHRPPARSPLTLGPDDHGRLVSAEEFARAEYLEPWKYEREAGRLVVMAPDGQRHVDESRPWRKRLYAYRDDHPDVVEDVLGNAWVRVDGGTDRIGDIGVYLVAEGPVPPIPDRVPELMFEVVSPAKTSRDRDYVKKREEYYRLGVREYVVINRRNRKVTVFTHASGGYEQRVLTVGDTYTTPLLPGPPIPLAEVFRG